MHDLAARQVADGLVMICGESNVVSLIRRSGNFRDPLGFNQRMDELGISVILNPVHNYMRRYEMKKKRAYYSANGRVVVSVWNQGRPGGESRRPWTAHRDGGEVTDLVVEQPAVIAERPDVRIGVFEIIR